MSESQSIAKQAPETSVEPLVHNSDFERLQQSIEADVKSLFPNLFANLDAAESKLGEASAALKKAFTEMKTEGMDAADACKMANKRIARCLRFIESARKLALDHAFEVYPERKQQPAPAPAPKPVVPDSELTPEQILAREQARGAQTAKVLAEQGKILGVNW